MVAVVLPSWKVATELSMVALTMMTTLVSSVMCVLSMQGLPSSLTKK